MKQNKLFFSTALKLLENKNNMLVSLDGWNGLIRNYDGEELGQTSSKVTQKLTNSDKLEFKGNGTGLLNHEKYYKLKGL